MDVIKEEKYFLPEKDSTVLMSVARASNRSQKYLNIRKLIIPRKLMNVRNVEKLSIGAQT